MDYQSFENQPETTPVAAPPIGHLYDIGGGRRLMLHHAGSGSPAVVFEVGAGAFGLDYFNLLAPVARRTTGVLYDRAGSGWSDVVAGPRSTAAIVADLHEGLRVAAINGPYVLVGHSLGGLLVRAFAQHFPGEVAGLVLIDPAAEGLPLAKEGDEKIVQNLIEQLRANPALWREWQPEVFEDFDKLPAHIREPLIARHMDREHDTCGLRDMMSAPAIVAAVANGPALPDVPVIVLTGMKIDRTPGRSDEQMVAFNQMKRAAHQAIAASLPHGEHRVFEDVGHRLNSERPDLVIDAIFAVLDRATTH